MRHSLKFQTPCKSQMAAHPRLESFVVILCWVIRLQHWQSTHALQDLEMLLSGPQDSETLSLECCVCFETRAAPRKACVQCKSNLPVCEKCLHSWSWAAGSLKSCVVCRKDECRPFNHRGPLDLLSLRETPALSCIFMIFMYILVHYSWLIVAYRAATSLSLF